MENIKKCVLHINAYNKVTSEDGDFNSQMYRKIHFMDSTNTISLAIPFIGKPDGFISKEVVVARKVMCGIDGIDFHSPRLTSLQSLLSVQSDNR